MNHSYSGLSISAAAIAFAGAMALSGCGDPPKPVPGVGYPNPNGMGILHADTGKTPAATQANAKRQDIHSYKELKALVDKCVTINDYEKLFGPSKLAYKGPYAGHIIFPNLYYDGWFVESLMLETQTNIDMRELVSLNKDYNWRGTVVFPKEIPFIRAENAEWFTSINPKSP